MSTRNSLTAFTVVLLVAALGHGVALADPDDDEAEEEIEAGGLDQACYADDTCDSGLFCHDDTCHRDWGAEVVASCSKSFLTSRSKKACISAMRWTTVDPAPVVGSCTSGFPTSRSQIQCLEVAVVSADVDACTGAFVTTRSKLECLKLGTPARWVIGDVVSACTSTFRTTRTQLSCIGHSARKPKSPHRAVLQCGEAFYTTSDRLDCIEQL